MTDTKLPSSKRFADIDYKHDKPLFPLLSPQQPPSTICHLLPLTLPPPPLTPLAVPAMVPGAPTHSTEHRLHCPHCSHAFSHRKGLLGHMGIHESGIHRDVSTS
ncbi:unnamed protein product [Schistocephalus solidus]|uniref:C2H2-type domain-containing protein n=1 Tax=Schistocephalus solidus TaxID=70667 RepID=A0A183TM60_SCHSO|nr:unnamed protein product [Schistocephalus solidus]